MLGKSYNEDFTLTLPEKKLIRDIKWLAIYDLSRYVSKIYGANFVPIY